MVELTKFWQPCEVPSYVWFAIDFQRSPHRNSHSSISLNVHSLNPQTQCASLTTLDARLLQFSAMAVLEGRWSLGVVKPFWNPYLLKCSLNIRKVFHASSVSSDSANPIGNGVWPISETLVPSLMMKIRKESYLACVWKDHRSHVHGGAIGLGS